jgi:hypothetical protein
VLHGVDSVEKVAELLENFPTARSGSAVRSVPMDVAQGFKIEQPEALVPWGISETEFERDFGALGLRRVTHGYFTTHCVSLRGLPHELGFQFYPRGAVGLNELEFFRSSPRSLEISFQEFQRHLEATFGKPTITTQGQEGFPFHRWQLSGADVVHFVIQRFGPEEHVRIKTSSTVLASACANIPMTSTSASR